MRRRWACGGVFLLICLLFSVAPAARAQQPPSPGQAATWLRTVHQAPLWSGPTDPAQEFTVLPVGAFLLPRAGSESGRIRIYYPGDGQQRQPGEAWIAAGDVAPSGPPPWLTVSDLDGDNASPTPPESGLRRSLVVAPPNVSAPEVAVVDDDTGLLLYGRAQHAREAPASTTKIATAIVALEHAPSLAATLRITIDGSAMAIADGSSIMGLVPGRQLSIRTLLYGLLLPSGNDAAEQLAIGLADSREQFVAWMNQTVEELGLKDTHFVNPSGLDADGHYASAYDLAQLARLAMRDEAFRMIVRSPSLTSDGYVLQGHNPLLGVYPGIDGVKTGTTDAAGHAIVASASRDGHRVYVVVLHSDDLVADCSALFDWTWSSFAWSA